MAIDEVLLERAVLEDRAHLRIYAWAGPTVSIGYFQGIDERAAHPASRGCPLVRRPSGGGAIVHDQEVTYALAVPGAWRASQQRDLYHRVHRGLVESLVGLGAAATLCPPRPAGEAKTDPFLCFQRKMEGDVAIGDCKVIGSAQRRGRGAVVQHGSILLGASPAAPELPGIEDLSPARMAREDWALRVRDSVLHVLDFTPQLESLSAGEQMAALRLVDEKYGRAQWHARR
ncbi:MAG TPA: biotin/lipoate A/B protein ligase family protein [Pirellulales bacterium]|nr:biotin/lipoate A/B protein ligase family protein [Pirellulales bacterium]